MTQPIDVKVSMTRWVSLAFLKSIADSSEESAVWIATCSILILLSLRLSMVSVSVDACCTYTVAWPRKLLSCPLLSLLFLPLFDLLLVAFFLIHQQHGIDFT